MENLWQDILNDGLIIDRYNEINKVTNYVIDHGLLHVQNVLNYIDKICDLCNIDNKKRNLSKIAGALHDVGRLDCWHGHAEAGGKFASEYLNGKLNEDDLQIVVDAIVHHDKDCFDENSTNDIAWILYMADKMDYTRDRYVENLIDEEAKNKFSYNIKEINLIKKDNTSCIIEIVLFEDREGFKENANRITDVHVKVLDYFGFKTVDIRFKVLK